MPGLKDFNLETIQRILLGRSGGRSIRIKIQRRVVILRGTKYWFQNIFKLIDAELNFIDNQLIVSKVKKDGRASLAGIKNGDIVINLDKIKPEYLVGDNLEKYIEGEEYSKLELIIERDVILRKK